MLLTGLAILAGFAAVMLYRAPVRRYVVSCARTTQVACVIEQTRSTGTQRWLVPVGPGASAVVRVMPQRRGPARVLLYLASPAQTVFAAEFEGADATSAAEAAATRLNDVLRAEATAATRVEVEPPPVLRWLAWAGLAVMGVLIGASYRGMRSRAEATSTTSV